MIAQSSAGKGPETSEKSLALWEIVSVVTSGLIALWAIHAFAGRFKWIGSIPILLALGLVVFSHRERGEGPRELGFRLDNFINATRVLLIPTAIAIGLIVLFTWQLDEAEFSLRPARIRLLLVPFWALVQQYVLQGFINRRAQIVFGPGSRSALVVSLAFCLLHLPSMLLGVSAFVGAFVWARIYQREPNLIALALSHTAVSLTLSLLIPESHARELRIGIKYFGMYFGLC